MNNPEPKRMRTWPSTPSQGGLHAAPIGTSTKDVTDKQDQQERLRDFEAELERVRFGCVAGREW